MASVEETPPPAGVPCPQPCTHLICHIRHDEMHEQAHRELRNEAFRSEVDSSSHKGEELPDWMSELFEKLDLELNEDNICSTGKVTCSTGKVTEEADPILEGGISSEIHRSLKGKDSAMAKLSFHSFYNEDQFDDWVLKMLKLEGFEFDCCSLPEVDQEEEDLIQCDVPDEYMEKISYKETIENGFKWMSEECFLAFTKSVEKFNFEGIEHKFGKLHSQCLSVESYNKTFHHYNFTVEEKHKSSDVWTSNLYFAEVKQLSGVKIYFCCLLDPNDNGHCYGCKNQDRYDLKHPISGGYEEGDAGICWPFMDDTDSDDDCGLGY